MTVQYGRVISIPSGTIKSVLARERSESEQEFQFLLVRLKGSFNIVVLIAHSHFNSFWYD